jgi:hypothetical protein
MSILDLTFENLESVLGLKLFEFFDVDPGYFNPGSGIQDGKKSDPG